jgi:ubiquinone/menaquinone biosynthesis C-methylase UbiE
MQANLPAPDDWVSSVTETAYRAFQWGKNTFGFAHKALSTQAVRLMEDALVATSGGSRGSRPEIKITETTLQIVRDRYESLLATDWREAEQGYYPQSLLFDNPWVDFALYYPQVWLDLPLISQRVNQRQYQLFQEGIDTTGYPRYYLQNFHYQTDGYLSEQSANLYDLQVDLLFGGSADAMRRRVIRPLKDHLAQTGVLDRSTRILDLACGTGRTLRMLRGALPEVSLFGTDLSPAYLRKANQVLNEIPGELPQLLQANSEELPYTDNLFDAITCVFLFHELPAPARQNVINEAARVLKPGGVLLICDSVQMFDSPDLIESMEAFVKTFHEPYYRDYIRDDLGIRLRDAGLTLQSESTHYVSHYWVATKG